MNFCFATVDIPDDSSSPTADDAADGDTSPTILFAEMPTDTTNASFVFESTVSLVVVGGPSIIIRSSVDIRVERKRLGEDCLRVFS